MYNRHRKGLDDCCYPKCPVSVKNRRRKISGCSNICKVTIFLSSNILSNSRMLFIKLMRMTKTYCPGLHLVMCNFDSFGFL